MNNVDKTYRKINRFDDLDMFSRARLMNIGEYDEYLQEKEIETYKQALQDIEELLLNEEQPIQPSYIRYNILKIIEKVLGDKEDE